MNIDFLGLASSANSTPPNKGGLERRNYGVRKSTTTGMHDNAARGDTARRGGLLHAHYHTAWQRRNTPAAFHQTRI
ncbi:MAG: hypothetical protein JST91_17970 [Actinobacteria bacterium]|nr:hypothetical protein [Actinomycetota bacterium]